MSMLLLLAFAFIPPATEKPKTNEFDQPIATHVVTFPSAYYLGGPQQARPPEGEFKAGLRLTLLQNAGSYSLVRAENGVTAYVASGAFRSLLGKDGDESIAAAWKSLQGKWELQPKNSRLPKNSHETLRALINDKSSAAEIFAGELRFQSIGFAAAIDGLKKQRMDLYLRGAKQPWRGVYSIDKESLRIVIRTDDRRPTSAEDESAAVLVFARSKKKPSVGR